MLFLHIAISIDGYIEDRDGGIDWFRESDDFDAHIVKLLGSIEGMIFGRKAHELLATYWPTAGESPIGRPHDPEVVRLMNTFPKYVLTRSGRCAEWSHSYPVDTEGVAALKRAATRDLALFAGAGAAQALSNAGLVDAATLIVHPVRLGGGTPLFEADGQGEDLQLTELKRFRPDIAVLSYEPARP